jgi:phenylacetate-CoA oxygenase PaaH subunit
MTDSLPADRDLAADARPPLEAWEVFRQEKEGDPMRHGGSVMAPDAVLAVHYARELFGRRQESIRLWVVRRTDIHDLADQDLLQPPLDRSFKKPGGYVMRDKLAAARARSGREKSSGEEPRGAQPSSGGRRRVAPPSSGGRRRGAPPSSGGRRRGAPPSSGGRRRGAQPPTSEGPEA